MRAIGFVSRECAWVFIINGVMALGSGKSMHGGVQIAEPLLRVGGYPIKCTTKILCHTYIYVREI
jgi:hypothetical protein